ncbi:MAG: AI-2E family transporter, partial [Dethiobacteria bacterium]
LFYLLRDGTIIEDRILGLFPEKYRFRIEIAVSEIGKTLSAYLRGIVFISLLVGGLLYGGLLILKVKFALFLAIINAFTNIIPYFGPLIGALPVVTIAYLQSPALVWKTVALIIIVQQLENQFIAPQILGKNLGFHPLTIILALLLAGSYLGFLGLVFIVPLLAILRVFYSFFYPVIKEAWKGWRLGDG